MSTLENEIRVAINRNSVENASDTPDFILAQFLTGCLDAFNAAVKLREDWYGRAPQYAARGVSEVHDG